MCRRGNWGNCDCDFVSSRHQALSKNPCHVTERLINRLVSGRCDLIIRFGANCLEFRLRRRSRKVATSAIYGCHLFQVIEHVISLWCKLGAECIQFAPNFTDFRFAKSSHKSFGMYGGDDGARTRDLCRDRAAL